MEDRGAGRVHFQEDQLEQPGQADGEGERGSDFKELMRMMLKSQMEAAERAELRRVEEKREDRRLAELAEDRRKGKLAEKKALSDRQYQQQMELMEKQAQLGELAAAIHRRELDASKKRERALFSVPNWKEGEDLENYLSTA